MNTKKKIIAVIIGIETVIIAAVIVFLFYINSDTVKINRQLELAQRYLLEEDYEQAIAALEVVIETDPKNAEAYLGLAEAYEAAGDIENVVKILERGSKRTDSDEIRELLKEHTEEIEKRERAAQAAAEAAQAAADASQANSNAAENAAEDEKELFREYLTTVLIPANGIFVFRQKGTMYTPDDAWLEPGGIMDATFLDFDKDGAIEMLLCYATQTASSGADYQINMDIYEIVNGAVVLSSSVPFGEYYDGLQGSGRLSEHEWAEIILGVNVVQAEGTYYIVCKAECVYGCFADGYDSNDWVMTYKDGKLQYVLSYTQTAGGSSDFEYTGYEFVNGQCTNSELYYSETDAAPYDDMGIARAAFYKKHGIMIDDSGNLLYNAADITPVFEFRNEMINCSYGDAYEFYCVAEFEASLTAYGEQLAQ